MQDNGEIIHISGDNTPELPELKKEDSVEILVEQFLAQHDVRKSSRDRYRKSLKGFLKWIKGKKIEQITREYLLEYKEMLLAKGKSTMTVGAYLVSIRLFYEYLYQEYNIKNIAKGVASPKRTNKFEHKPLTEEQSSKLLEYFKDNLRDYAIINLMLRTGMRTIEIVRSNIGDIGEIGGKRCLYLQGKGRDDKKEYVLTTDKTLNPIKEYIKARPNFKEDEPIFISKSKNNFGERLTTKTISLIARTGLDAIGLKGKDGYTAHSLRHTAASIMLSRGISLDRIRSVFRHKNMSTTLGYATMADERKRIEESPEAALDDAF
ncbi:MAG: tyrosine-type recombinase/integrase [Nanoarchaeota archaeon]